MDLFAYAEVTFACSLLLFCIEFIFMLFEKWQNFVFGITAWLKTLEYLFVTFPVLHKVVTNQMWDKTRRKVNYLKYMYIKWKSQSVCMCGFMSSAMIYLAQGGTPDFKWWGWSKDIFGFEIFDSGIFGGRRIWQVFFWVCGLIEVGICWVFKTISRFLVVLTA